MAAEVDPRLTTSSKSSDSGRESMSKEESLITERGGESFVGNVSNYTAIPDSYKGPTNKGHLIFDACFEGGQWIFYKP